jgi:nitrate reductase gamma subunit
MMAARRYAIRRCSWGRIADVFYNSRLLSMLALSIFPLILLGIFATSHGPIITDHVDMWSFIPMDMIHELGLIVMGFLGFSVLANLFLMYRNLSNVRSGAPSTNPSSARRAGIWVKTLVTTGVNEVLAQKRFTKCDDNTIGVKSMNKYWAHMALFWGFLGLAGATMLDYGINEYGLNVSRDVSRVLGIVAGIAMMYGAGYFIYKRLKKDEVFSKFSHFSDWIFLILLFFGGLTGFLVTAFLYAGWAEATYAALVIHLMVSFDLLITLPFTKFAHAVYRPFALWIVTAGDRMSSQTSPP